MSDAPFLTSAAVVTGSAAHVLAVVLRRAVSRGELDGLPDGVRRAAASAIEAVALAGRAWQDSRASADGSNQARVAEAGASSARADMSTAEAADVMGVTERRARQLAPSLGRKVGGVWRLDPALVNAYMESR